MYFTAVNESKRFKNDKTITCKNIHRERYVENIVKVISFGLPWSGFCSLDELIFRDILAVTETDTPSFFEEGIMTKNVLFSNCLNNSFQQSVARFPNL